MISPRTITEERLAVGLHRHPLTPQTVEDIYPWPHTITAHVYRALGRWEAEGLIIRSHAPAGAAYALAPTAINPTWRRAALVMRATEVNDARTDLMHWLDKSTSAAAQFAARIAPDIPDDPAALAEHCHDAGEYLASLSAIQSCRTQLAQLDQDELIIRAEARDAGFDPDAICAGQADDVARGADPLGAAA